MMLGFINKCTEGLLQGDKREEMASLPTECFYFTWQLVDPCIGDLVCTPHRPSLTGSRPHTLANFSASQQAISMNQLQLSAMANVTAMTGCMSLWQPHPPQRGLNQGVLVVLSLFTPLSNRVITVFCMCYF